MGGLVAGNEWGNDTGTRALTWLLALSLPAHVARLLCCNLIHTSNLADFERLVATTMRVRFNSTSRPAQW